MTVGLAPYIRLSMVAGAWCVSRRWLRCTTQCPSRCARWAAWASQLVRRSGGGGASVLEAESCLERSRRDWLPSRDHASVASQPPTLHPHAQRPRSAHAQPPFSLHMLTRPCASTYIHVQGMLYYPCAGDEFFFTITETFWPDRSGVDHPLTFTTVPPVMASCIKAAGSHWVRYKVS
jgi:hypothetical protein